MSRHVFVKLCGYGCSLVPYAPYIIDRVKGDTVIRINSNNRIAVLDFSRDDLAPILTNAQSLSEVVDVARGAFQNDWIIATTSFSVSWPDTHSLTSAQKDWPPFDLVGPDGSVLWFQGCFPNERVTPERMTASGMRMQDHGESGSWHWYEFAYQHEEITFIQRWYFKSFNAEKKLVITAQMREAGRSTLIPAVEQFAESFRSHI